MTLSLTGGDTKDREAERVVKLVISFQQFNELDCAGVETDERGIRALHYPIRGNIGMAEVIDQYLKVFEQPKSKFAKDPLAYTDTLVFTTTLTATLNPSIILTPTPVTQVIAGLSDTPTRRDTHTVIVSLLPPTGAADAVAITRVQIIKDDGGLIQ